MELASSKNKPPAELLCQQKPCTPGIDMQDVLSCRTQRVKDVTLDVATIPFRYNMYQIDILRSDVWRHTVPTMCIQVCVCVYIDCSIHIYSCNTCTLYVPPYNIYIQYLFIYCIIHTFPSYGDGIALLCTLRHSDFLCCALIESAA